MSALHPYTLIPLPQGAPFELRPSRGKGWGAFATKPIPAGSVILREDAFFSFNKPLESITEQDVDDEWNKLPVMMQFLYTLARNNGGEPFGSPAHAFTQNAFSTKEMYGFYLVQSRFNHSCVPNSRMPRHGGAVMERVATKDIAVGEEITFCYDPSFSSMTRAERHAALKFECHCKACAVGTPFHEASEVRRILFREVQFVVCQADLAKPDDPRFALIPNLELRKQARDGTIPLSNRVIFDIMLLALAEQEGILDDATLEQITPRLYIRVAFFQSRHNAIIARLAMHQETWLGKLQVATYLWNKDDPGDEEVNKIVLYQRKRELLRQMEKMEVRDRVEERELRRQMERLRFNGN